MTASGTFNTTAADEASQFPIPDTWFWQRMALGHRLRLGHDLAGYLVSADGSVCTLVRTCCDG